MVQPAPHQFSAAAADHGAVSRLPWDTFRAAMPVTQRWVYLDHAAIGALPEPSRKAISRWCQQAADEGDTVWLAWRETQRKTRELAANMIGANEQEIAFIPSTTAGITLVSEGFPWREGDNLVTLANEFPSNLYPWMHLASRGVETRRVPVAEGGRVDLDRLLASCDSRTRMVALSWISFSSGFRLDLARAVEACHARGIYFFLDAIQGLGVFPLDVGQVPIDFLAADGHKWMLGPEGIGIFYLRQEHLDILRPIGVGWNSVEHAYDFDRIEIRWKQSAARYEGGTQNMIGAAALGASLELLWQLGVGPRESPVAQRILEVTDYACDQLAQVGAEVVSPREQGTASGIVAFRWPRGNHDEIRSHCLRSGIALSHRAGCLRISPHAYNNEAEIDHLISVLGEPSS